MNNIFNLLLTNLVNTLSPIGFQFLIFSFGLKLLSMFHLFSISVLSGNGGLTSINNIYKAHMTWDSHSPSGCKNITSALQPSHCWAFNELCSSDSFKSRWCFESTSKNKKANITYWKVGPMDLFMQYSSNEETGQRAVIFYKQLWENSTVILDSKVAIL